jgi:hypothetical protein
VDKEEIAALGRAFGAPLALHLELIRLSGTLWVQRREGWLPFDRETRVALGLAARSTCSRAVNRLVDLGFIEVRGMPGSRLDYRLNPRWAQPKVKVINLAAAKEARERN